MLAVRSFGALHRTGLLLRPDLCSVNPVEKKEVADERQRSGNKDIDKEWKSPPGNDHIEYCKYKKHNAADPLPFPRNDQCCCDNDSRNKMHYQICHGFSAAGLRVKNIQSKVRRKECKENGQDPRRPKQDLFHHRTHAVKSYRINGTVNGIQISTAADALRRKNILIFIIDRKEELPILTIHQLIYYTV